MADEKIISKILNIVDYYIDNHRYNVEPKFTSIGVKTYCTGLRINSLESYSIIIDTLNNEKRFAINVTDSYGNSENYSVDNEIFRKFIDEAIERVLGDSELTVLERIEKENRKINLDKLV